MRRISVIMWSKNSPVDLAFYKYIETYIVDAYESVQKFSPELARRGRGDDNNLGRVLQRGMSKNMHFKFFESQMYFPAA